LPVLQRLEYYIVVGAQTGQTDISLPNVQFVVLSIPSLSICDMIFRVVSFLWKENQSILGSAISTPNPASYSTESHSLEHQNIRTPDGIPRR